MIPVLIVLICLGLSFFFSGMEVAVLLLNRVRIRHLKEKGSRGAKILLLFSQKPGLLSSTVLVGNTIVNTVATILVALFFSKMGGPIVAMVAVFLFSIVLWLCGELIPKSLFRKYPNRLATSLAPFLFFAYIGLWPIVQLFNFLSQAISRMLGGKVSSRQIFAVRDELKLMAHEGEHGVELTGEQRNLVTSILDSPNATVRDVMRPKAEVTTVKSRQSEKEMLALATATSYSRFPIEKGSSSEDWDEIWVAYDSLFQTRMRPRTPPSVPATTSLEETLSILRKTKSSFGFVRDRAGHAIGIITVEDILRKYLGKIDL